MFDVSLDVELGKSIAGVQLGAPLSDFLNSNIEVIDEVAVAWSTEIIIGNKGFRLFKFKDGGSVLYCKNSLLELSFNKNDVLISISAGVGYVGNIYRNVKIGDGLGTIDHKLYLDDTNDVHYLCDEKEDIVPGVFFVADGEPVEEDPEQEISRVCVYDWSL